MRVIVYLHASRETMWEKGEALGLTGEALSMFSFACYEVKVDLDVDQNTGVATIIAVDDRKLGRKITT
jgi:phosphoribosyl-AMP cyclohydrolase